ncbi:MAG TPA: hypothetical protein VGR02_21625 [Thermoanaerobaculia bacterium]|nr:hypothetical protein [Thermoanaerobaculia bacterium]
MLITVTPIERVLTVGLADVVHAFGAANADLRWTLLHFYGTTSPTMPLWKGMAALELEAAAATGLPPMEMKELIQLAESTTDIYDVLLVGSKTLEQTPRGVRKNPVEYFNALAAQYEAVVECVDSGVWRISIADRSVAEAVRRSLARQPDVSITDVAPWQPPH